MLMVGTTSLASAQQQFEVVASGLDSPRHLTFSASGELLRRRGRPRRVRWEAVPLHPELGEFCLGFTGAVTEGPG